MLKKSILFALILLLTGCAQVTATPTTVPTAEPPKPTATIERQGTPSEMGYEMFAYRDDNNEWTFGLVLGDNAGTSCAAVKEKPLKLDEFKRELHNLAAGEEVFWLTDCYDEETDALVVFPVPPPALIDEISLEAQAAKIKLTVLIYN